MASSVKPAAWSALALAFASLGDAFLYAFLPLNGAAVGVPPMAAGIILSINRVVRIILNTRLVSLFPALGVRRVMIVAAILSVVSTSAYGIATTLSVWISLRIIWGVAFSILRTGASAYALQHEHSGLALGISRGLQETGPLFSMLLIPILLTFRTDAIFWILALLSLPAIYFALSLPADTPRVVQEQNRLPIELSLVNVVTLVTAFLIDGVFVVVLGAVFLRYDEGMDVFSATGLAALCLAYRRVCFVLLAVSGGWLADRLGVRHVFNLSLAGVTAGVCVLLTGWVASGAMITFAFYSVHVAVTPGAAAAGCGGDSIRSIAGNATWRDAGAAAGTLAGALLIKTDHIGLFLETGLCVLLIALAVCFRHYRLLSMHNFLFFEVAVFGKWWERKLHLFRFFASYSKELILMKSQTQFPTLTKTKLSAKAKGPVPATACCSPKENESVCCTPSKTSNNDGACCDQPADGSACCVK